MRADVTDGLMNTEELLFNACYRLVHPLTVFEPSHVRRRFKNFENTKTRIAFRRGIQRRQSRNSDSSLSDANIDWQWQ